MAQRRDRKLQGLDNFPTPPWAVRALIERQPMRGLIWEPTANRGYMERTLIETGAQIVGSDIHDYGAGYPVYDFLDPGNLLDGASPCPGRPDWIVTNPPFKAAVEFAERAMQLATTGVALLCRLQWLESGDRYKRIYSVCPPPRVLIFCDRPAMVQGRYDPGGSTATCYAWFVWHAPFDGKRDTVLEWIPPGTKARLFRPTDAAMAGSETVPVAPEAKPAAP